MYVNNGIVITDTKLSVDGDLVAERNYCTIWENESFILVDSHDCIYKPKKYTIDAIHIATKKVYHCISVAHVEPSKVYVNDTHICLEDGDVLRVYELVSCAIYPENVDHIGNVVREYSKGRFTGMSTYANPKKDINGHQVATAASDCIYKCVYESDNGLQITKIKSSKKINTYGFIDVIIHHME